MAARSQPVEDFVSQFDGDVAAAKAALEQYVAQHPGPARSRPARSGRKPATEVIVSVQNVVREYRRGKRPVNALNGVSLDVHQGEFLALTGASGSGKSTLLQLIGGLDRPTNGRLVIDGQDINQLKDEALSELRNRTIGFVFQFFYLQPFLPLVKNIEVPGMFAHTDPRIRTSRVDELIEKVGLSEQKYQLPKQLSGGQIQRAAIARALLNSPKLLLADEPTGNLDSTNSAAIIDLFKQIRDELGTTVVIVTHNPEIAAQADREIRLNDGALV